MSDVFDLGDKTGRYNKETIQRTMAENLDAKFILIFVDSDDIINFLSTHNDPKDTLWTLEKLKAWLLRDEDEDNDA